MHAACRAGHGDCHSVLPSYSMHAAGGAATDSWPPVACPTTRGSGKCAPGECPQCTSFLLLHKCATTTLLKVLHAPEGYRRNRTHSPIGRCGGFYYCDWRAYGASTCSAGSASLGDLADRRGAWLYFGGYLQAMAPHVATRGCIRIAVLREPVSRLLSARSYCSHNGKGAAALQQGDVLCGNMSSGTPTEWAVHWGSYLFRQLALEPSVFSMLATRGVASTNSAHCADAACVEAAARPFTWVDQKRVFGANDDGHSTKAGRAVLRQLVRRLESGALFDVVGIYEHWAASMALLDATVPLSGGRTWVVEADLKRSNAGVMWSRGAGGEVASSGAAARARETRRATLEATRKDATVRQLLAADLELYSAATRRFALLVARHGITPAPSRV